MKKLLQSATAVSYTHLDVYKRQVKGIGHGYGFDQYGAGLKAKEGWTAEKILEFYYKNIVVVFE